MKVYIAGPMRGIPQFNAPQFDHVADHLRQNGHEVVNPVDHDRECYPHFEYWEGFATGDVRLCPEFDFAEAMRWDIAQITECDAICLLPEWEHSVGAVMEHKVAVVCGLKVLLWGWA